MRSDIELRFHAAYTDTDLYLFQADLNFFLRVRCPTEEIQPYVSMTGTARALRLLLPTQVAQGPCRLLRCMACSWMLASTIVASKARCKDHRPAVLNVHRLTTGTGSGSRDRRSLAELGLRPAASAAARSLPCGRDAHKLRPEAVPLRWRLGYGGSGRVRLAFHLNTSYKNWAKSLSSGNDSMPMTEYPSSQGIR